MNNNDPFRHHASAFLAQLGGLTVAGWEPSLLTPRRATAHGDQRGYWIRKEGILTGRTGAIRATVKDGRFVAAKPFELDKYPSK